MSHPVFLNNAPQARMPNGSANEWSMFFSEDRQELQANAFFPLLWMALFTAEDLRWAKLIDDEDIDSRTHEEMDAAQVRYPYLVATQESALMRFAQRKPRLQAALGQKYEDVVNTFEEFLRSKYSPCILLRTSGLPDPETLQPGLLAALTEMEEFCQGKPAVGFVELGLSDVRSQDGKTALYLLTGAGQEEVWPPSALAERFGIQQKVSSRASERRQNNTAAPASSYRSNPVSEWGGAIVLGLVTTGVYLRTHSVLLSVLTFLGMTVIVVFVLLKVMKRP